MHNVLAVSKRCREVIRAHITKPADAKVAVRAIAGHVFGHDDTALIGEGGPAQLALAPAVGPIRFAVDAAACPARRAAIRGVPSVVIAVHAGGAGGVHMATCPLLDEQDGDGQGGRLLGNGRQYSLYWPCVRTRVRGRRGANAA